MMPTGTLPMPRTDAERYLRDRHAFRRAQILLPDGRTFGEAEEPWQQQHVFGPLDTQTGLGEPLYRLLYYELPRGHAKSTVAAMEAITLSVMERGWRIYIGAGDQDEAAIILSILRGMVNRNPRLRGSFNLGKWEAFVRATSTVIRVLTSDGSTTYGLGGIGRGYVFIAYES